jgi:hypothetical protein
MLGVQCHQNETSPGTGTNATSEYVAVDEGRLNASLLNAHLERKQCLDSQSDHWLRYSKLAFFFLLYY